MKSLLVALAILAFASSDQAADGPSCTIPPDIRPARSQPPPAHEVSKHGPTASYTLALTWSPEWRRTRADSRDARVQCRDNRFGLWPNGGGKAHPHYCGPAPALDVATVRTAFTARNPHLRRDALFLKVGDGDRLQEVRVCYDLRFKPMRCARGVGAPDHVSIRAQSS